MYLKSHCREKTRQGTGLEAVTMVEWSEKEDMMVGATMKKVLYVCCDDILIC